MNKALIKMTPGDDTHLTLPMAPVSLNFVTGTDREHLLAYGRAAFEAGQKCQGCAVQQGTHVPAEAVVQIQEPVALPIDEKQIKALMRKHRIWIEVSRLFESNLPERELRAVQAEEHQFKAFVQDLISASQLAAVQHAALEPFGYVNTHTGQFFKDVELCRKNNEGHWRTVYTHPTQQGLDAREFPAMTPELASILGLMCFQCIPFAQALRAGGQQINTRAEDEQAAVLHWMLGHYFKHGDSWRDAAAEDMERMKDASLAAQAKQGGE